MDCVKVLWFDERAGDLCLILQTRYDFQIENYKDNQEFLQKIRLEEYDCIILEPNIVTPEGLTDNYGAYQAKEFLTILIKIFAKPIIICTVAPEIVNKFFINLPPNVGIICKPSDAREIFRMYERLSKNTTSP